MFICKCCTYETNDPPNFARHQKSIRHKNKMKEFNLIIKAQAPKEIIMSDNLAPPSYKCDDCQKQFTVKSNLYRHQRGRCVKPKNEVSNSEFNELNEFNELKKILVNLQQDLKNKDKIIQQFKDAEIDKLKEEKTKLEEEVMFFRKKCLQTYSSELSSKHSAR